MQCARCGAIFEGRFCPRCGAPAMAVPAASMGWPCPRCGTLFRGNFCPRCGLPTAAWGYRPPPPPSGGRSVLSVLWTLALVGFIIFEIRDHEDDEADQREGPEHGEDGPASGRRRRGPVAPRGRRKAAAGTEISTEEGAAAGAGPTHRSHGRSHRGRAATRTETALENGAAASALHPSAYEHPALFNGAVLERS